MGDPKVSALSDKEKRHRRESRKQQSIRRQEAEKHEEREARLRKRRARDRRNKENKQLVAENKRRVNGSADDKRPVDATMLEEICKLQPTMPELASAFGLTRVSLYRRFEAEPELRDAYDRGMAAGKLNLKRHAWRMAFGFEETETIRDKKGIVVGTKTTKVSPSEKMTEFVLKNVLGWTNKTEISGAPDKPAAIQHTNVSIGNVTVGLSVEQVRDVKANFLGLKVAPDPEPEDVIEVSADADNDDRGTG